MTLKLRLLGFALILMSFISLDTTTARAQGNSESACPQRPSQGICIQVIAYGKNPGNGRCCVFSTPCAVPPGWDVFFTLEECEAA